MALVERSFSKTSSKWVHPYPDHPSDELKIKFLLDEKIKGDRIIGLEAKIEPGKIHQLHMHENEYVLVYTIQGRCKVTIGKKNSDHITKDNDFSPTQGTT